ncbi:MAG: hypothetical protein WC525_07255 [Candidatus Thermoplasmatota archaeon]
MKKNFIKVICTLFILLLFVVPTTSMRQPQAQELIVVATVDDFDPLVDNITVTLTIKEIRALKTINLLSKPDFYLKVTINQEEFASDVWENQQYLTDLDWSVSSEVPKNIEFVDITIALWDKNNNLDLLCDISPDVGNLSEARTAELTYSIAAGVWWGDDELGDPSGYGRLNGCDDNSIYQHDRDCELWFDITQNDFDDDGFPYWFETEVYNTSPLLDNRGEDVDHDGIPIEWEHHFGLTYYEWGHNAGYYTVLDPFSWENHSSYDDDDDALNNIEEYKTWQWGSDPYRQDIFLEIDQMEKEPGNQEPTVPLGSYEHLRDSHAKHNIVWHIDDGRLGGGEIVPYKADLYENDLNNFYWNYFMHQDANNWRRGVFHWGFVGYNASQTVGFTFGSRINGLFAVDCFYLPALNLNSQVKLIPLFSSLSRKTFNSEKQRALVYAGVIMHETGHSLGINNPGVDCHDGKWPWQVNYWRYGPYKSVMNYRYVYTDLVDYSDGSRGKNDWDDWAIIDLTNINPRPHW